VAQAFDVQEDLLPALKYKDEDGDLCTLVQASVVDMLEVNDRGTLRLFASMDAKQELPEAASVPQVLPLMQASPLPQDVTMESTTAFQHDEELLETDATLASDVTPEADVLQAAGKDEMEAELDEEEHEEEAEPDAPSDDCILVAMLTAMGFEQEEVAKALQAARGNAELAVDFLINGIPCQRTPLEEMQETVRALPGYVREQFQRIRNQLRETVASLKQRHQNVQERYDRGDFEHLQALQAALEDMRACLREYADSAKGAFKKARGTSPAPHEEEQLRKVESQIADAQLFLAETLSNLRARGSDMLQNVSKKLPGTAEADDACDESSAASQTMAEAASAAVDAAKVAMDAVDETMLDDELPAPSSRSDAAEATSTKTSVPEPCQPQVARNATALDQAQVLISKSFSTIRSQAPGLFVARRNYDGVTISSVPSDPVATATEHTHAAQDVSVHAREPEDADAVTAPAKNGSPDEFRLLSDEEDVEQKP
jgi:NACalpha-BTF3-like transcription factor